MTMATPPAKRSFVLSYDENSQKLIVCSINRADIDQFIASALTVEWPLSDLNFDINDEVARRLGITALSVLSIYNPSLKPHLHTTPLEPPKS